MSNKMHCSDAVNPIPSKGANYAHCNTALPPGLENLIVLLFIKLPKHEQLKWPVDSIAKVYYNARTYNTHAT